MIKRLFILILLLLPVFSIAERVRGITSCYKEDGVTVVLKLQDSASVFVYEKLYGRKYKLVMIYGYIDSGYIQNGMITAGAKLYDKNNLQKPVGEVVEAQPYSYREDANYWAYEGKKKVVFYLYIENTNIRPETIVERRWEKVLAIKNKEERQKVFDTFLQDFQFVTGILNERYNLHFIYEDRSPEGYNDFRIIIFTDSAKRIVAFANDGYRKVKAKTKGKGALDRKFKIFYLEKLKKEEKEGLTKAFKSNYMFRN